MKFPITILIITCITSIYCSGQDSVNRFSFLTRFISTDTSCDGYYINLANKDIKTGHPILLESGWPTPFHSSDFVFEKKYGINYKELGCTTTDDRNCLENYNKTIFASLDSTYGKKWRHKVRHGIMGFRKYKSSQ